MPAEPTVTAAPTACQPISGGRDFQVGSGAASSNGQTYSELDQVPWESLQAGDTVRIFYRATAYKGKILIGAQGTASAPVRICGVPDGAGNRPSIDGSGAVARAQLAEEYGSTVPVGGGSTLTVRETHEGRSVILVKPLAHAQSYTDFPSYVQIDGLKIMRAHPAYTFTDSDGNVQSYIDFGACIWIERGHHITVANNEITDCQMAIYTKSTDDGDFAVSKDIVIARNYLWGNGIDGDDHMHTTYTASQGLLIELNHYGPPRSGAAGNSIKDRSAGVVIRYNYIEEGAHSIDLVEAEDFPLTATTANSGYEYTFVYGNLIRKNGDTGSFFHYGGDHFGSNPSANWGEPWFRQGVLYFFDNTVYGTGSSAAIFQVSTTLERVEAWNNVFAFASTVGNPNMRTNQEINTAYWTAGGIVNLGVNWINSGWSDYEVNHPITGQLLGSANLITGATLPADTATLAPLTGSAVLGIAGSGPSMSSAHTATLQITPAPGFLAPPTARGTRQDLGGIEIP